MVEWTIKSTKGNGYTLHQYFVGKQEVEMVTTKTLDKKILEKIYEHSKKLVDNPELKILESKVVI